MHQWTEIVSQEHTRLIDTLYPYYLLKVSCSWLSWGIQMSGTLCWFPFLRTSGGVHQGLQRSWGLPFLHLWQGSWYLRALWRLPCENGLRSLRKWGRNMFKRIPWREWSCWPSLNWQSSGSRASTKIQEKSGWIRIQIWTQHHHHLNHHHCLAWRFFLVICLAGTALGYYACNLVIIWINIDRLAPP